jgi:hypothetical protein
LVTGPRLNGTPTVSSPASALAAARGQAIELPGQHVAEMIIAELAASLLQLDQRIQGLDQQIAATFRRHHQAMTIESMPGFRAHPGRPTAPTHRAKATKDFLASTKSRLKLHDADSPVYLIVDGHSSPPANSSPTQRRPPGRRSRPSVDSPSAIRPRSAS